MTRPIVAHAIGRGKVFQDHPRHRVRLYFVQRSSRSFDQRKLALFCINLHHRDTEGTENEIRTIFVAELRIVSVNSVPPWWIFRTPAAGEDSCFAGHDKALRIDRLLSMTHYSVV
jgi:hypothetical protein